MQKQFKHFYPNEQACDKKQIVNSWLCNTLIQNGCCEIFNERNDYLAMVLDSLSFQTSLELIKQKIIPNANRIIVPNPFEFTKMSENIRNIPLLEGIQLRNEYSGKFLTQIESSSIGLLYLDYTCTLTGCKRVRPKSEINAIFARKIFVSPIAFFALTLNIPRSYKDDTQKAVTEAFSFICEISKNSYKCKMLFNEVYSNVQSRMLFIVLQICEENEEIALENES